MKHSLALTIRRILDQEHIMHTLHQLGNDEYEIPWIKMEEGSPEYTSGVITVKTKIMDLPFGDA